MGRRYLHVVFQILGVNLRISNLLIPQAKATSLFNGVKETKANESYEKSIEKLKLAASICDALPLSSKREISFKINKNLAKLFLKINRKDKVVKRLKKCFQLDRDSYVVSISNRFLFYSCSFKQM